ncbi:asparagine synthase (glutamine-hydrolyzing) [Halorientalis pallida]|uniref:Putative asparagine synthetase [glutamine-hydrolyzing] n=1 Tax=Halorientalis pallida TaxID=2479928 RepID=A0A498KXD3_9EURY|nr:asparagine synthase (glutamine-hydrolyzing) [Halorientalis pallida]RXK47432.1 asparagine synthase (glutamine-hydrolyzing) [Halorientalis pallida]
MCGISGVVGVDDPSLLDEMTDCLTHRGPDSRGTYHDDGVMLGSRRLSIIDLGGGDQPIYNEDGDVVVVYNGEIYNYRQLRSALESRGHTFTTDTDTEVLVHGYEEYGRDVFERLNGMFAVALWDESAERLLLARDRAGIKPLYYAPLEDGLAFASEPKSILQGGLVAPAVDTEALTYFLQLRFSPSQTTLFQGIETVLPGHVLEGTRADDEWTWTDHEYWNPAMADATPPSNPAAAVEDALYNAVERQLVSDVPVGFYLSGGLDTSSVVAMAAEISDEPIQTFCMGFADQQWDERADARAVADHFGTDHHELTLDGSFVRDFPEMIWYADEPKRNLYPYYVAQEMREHVKVALGGLGADELFGGYIYRYSRLQEYEQLRDTEPADTRAGISETATRLLRAHLSAEDLDADEALEDTSLQRHIDDPARLYVLLNNSDVIGDIEVFRERAFGESLPDELVPAEWIRDRGGGAGGQSLVERSLDWDFQTKLPDDFLLVEDRMSMGHSLESRVPFLDNDLVDLALSLPQSEKFGSGPIGGTTGKKVLREAMRDRLPAAVFQKDKQGFTMPTYPFVRDELLPHARSILDDPHIVREGFVQDSYVRTLLDRDPAEALTPHYKLLWKLVALEIWFQMYIVEGAAGPAEIEHYYS